MRILLTIFFAETGIVLLLAPWSAYWDRNFFAESVPLLHDVIVNNFVRGAVSGVGLVNLGAAAAELRAIFTDRFVNRPVSIRPPATEV